MTDLIRVNGKAAERKIDWSKYKGAMTQQSIVAVDEQLNELRNAWE